MAISLAMNWPRENWPSCCGTGIRGRPPGLPCGVLCLLHLQLGPVIPRQPKPRVLAQFTPMLLQCLQVGKRTLRGLACRFDHAHQQAAYVRPMAGLEKVGILAILN